MMKKMSAWVALGSAMTAMFLYVAPAQAQATRTWVSGVGDDVNPCSRTAPCKTFAGAISKTATHGEINCLDPAGFGTVTITKSITLDCRNTHGSMLNSSVNAVNIAFDNFVDARKTVRLRGLAMNGADTGRNGVRITGANSAGSEVYIEDVLIDGNFAGNGRGVSDERSGGGKLILTNTTIRNLSGRGIHVASSVVGAGTVDVLLDNVHVHNATFGLSLSNGMRAAVNRSVFSGNTDAGISVDGTGQVSISGTMVSYNTVGIQANAPVSLSNSDVVFNGTGISGTVSSYVNNRIFGNTAPGTAPVPISPGLQ